MKRPAGIDAMTAALPGGQGGTNRSTAGGLAVRRGECSRITAETRVRVVLLLDLGAVVPSATQIPAGAPTAAAATDASAARVPAAAVAAPPLAATEAAAEPLTGVATPLPFLDHMLEQLARHGHLGLWVDAGYVGAALPHHLVEDVGLALGQALDRALGDRRDVARFGWALAPMDEALAEVALDLSGRGGFYLSGPAFSAEVADGYDTANALEFFKALAMASRSTVHLSLRAAGNAHHEIEACHKALALALRRAVARETVPPGRSGIPSTKGIL